MKTRLIDFDLAKAQAGAKVVTRAQEPVRILCYDRVDNRDTKYPIVALVTMMSETFENPHDYTLKGEWNALKGKTCYDLMIEEPEYEDGDFIVFGNNPEFPPDIAIFKGYWSNDTDNPGLINHACLHMDAVNYDNGFPCTSNNLRLATEYEKTELLIAISNDRKCWNADKKCIEEPPGMKHKFKPFEKVLVRDNYSEKWRANVFQAYDKNSSGDLFYRCINGVYWLCIPYEGNEALVNTDKTFKFEY